MKLEYSGIRIVSLKWNGNGNNIVPKWKCFGNAIKLATIWNVAEWYWECVLAYKLKLKLKTNLRLHKRIASVLRFPKSEN